MDPAIPGSAFKKARYREEPGSVWRLQFALRSCCVVAGKLALTFPARTEEVFEILGKELPAAWEVPGDQAAGGNPVLDRPYADLEYLGDVAVAVHRFEGKFLDGEDRLQHRVAAWFWIALHWFPIRSAREHTSGASAEGARVGLVSICKTDCWQVLCFRCLVCFLGLNLRDVCRNSCC